MGNDGWVWIGVALLTAITALLWRFNNTRRRVPLQNAVSALQSLSADLEYALNEELRSDGKHGDQRALNERIAFLFSIIACSIHNAGYGSALLRQEALVLLQMRLERKIAGMEAANASDFLHKRYNEYGPKLNMFKNGAESAVIASVYFSSLVRGQPPATRLAETVDATMQKLTLAWRMAVSSSRLYLDRSLFAEEFES